MRLVMLVAHSPEGEVQHRYVAKRIAEAFPDELQAIIIATGVPTSMKRKLARWWKRYTLAQIASRALIHVAGRLRGSRDDRQETFREVLFPDGDDGRMPRRDLIKTVPSHNGAECLRLLETLDPDIVVVYGTLIIGRKVIAASKRIINLHTGLSPRYRGSDTIFWPLHNGEPEHVGVTVHRLEAGLDSGPILARGRPRIEPSDDEDRLFAKSVKLGADLLCNAISREAAGLARPITQELDKGREYRSVERSVSAEKRTRKLLRGGLIAEGLEPWQEEF